ncbi:MAG: hypothetical protein EOP49_29195 [Sphingobacteriales bacterium]|nr:MAG: hypothetical protein EOP49_29195 [Sphingobacteriales bacterium]
MATAGTSVSMGSINLPSNSYATINGMVSDCAMQGVTNGYVLMRYGYMHLRYPISAGGSFSFNTLICGTNTPASFVAGDIIGMQDSPPLTFNIHPGNNSLGTLQACGVNTMEFFNYTINGTNYNYSQPTENFSHSWHGMMNAHRVTAASSAIGPHPIELFFSYPWTIAGSTQDLRILRIPNLNDSLNIIPGTTIGVHLTQWDALGGFVSGNFSGNFIGNPPARIPYSVTCNFKVRRGF